MYIRSFIILLSLYFHNINATEIQYYITQYFYINPHSYSINGVQVQKYNPGKLFDLAFLSKNDIYKKCAEKQESYLIVNLYPQTFYNPQMNTLTTDLKVRIYDGKGSLAKTISINQKNQVFLKEHSDTLITKHYSDLIDRLSGTLLLEKKLSNKIDGSFCKIFK